jgi:hypothetical protein
MDTLNTTAMAKSVRKSDQTLVRSFTSRSAAMPGTGCDTGLSATAIFLHP